VSRRVPSPRALLVLLASFGLAGCVSGTGEQQQVFVFARGGDSVGLDPSHRDDGESLKVCGSIFDTLVQFRPGTTEVEAALAESWEASPDGLTWTFYLRHGVKFHDGTAFDADAVLFSLNRQLDPNHPHHGVGGGYIYWSAMGMSDIVGAIEKIDPFTVRFTLKKPEAPFLANLAMNFASIVSPTAARKSGERFGFEPVGTGPFRFVSWAQQQKIVLEAYDGYWGGRPAIDRLIFEVIADANIRALRFRSGEIQAFDNPGPSELQAVSKLPFTRLLQEPGMNIGYLAMNLDKPPFDDVRVRRAINHAIDKKRIIEDIYKGTGTVAKNPIPPVLWSYEEGIPDFEHDKDKARALLAEAGLSEGFKTNLWYMPVKRPYMPDGKKVAEAIQLDLAEVGIQADLVTYEWATYLERTKKGDHDMALLGWSGDNGDPDNFLFVLLSKTAAVKPANNISFYRNEQFNSLLERAKESTDHAERDSLYREAQFIFHQDPPWVCLAHNLQTVVVHEDVQGFVLYPTTRKDFRGVSLKSATAAPGPS
jgi:ABC-type transport system substrate-binding protein